MEEWSWEHLRKWLCEDEEGMVAGPQTRRILIREVRKRLQEREEQGGQQIGTQVRETQRERRNETQGRNRTYYLPYDQLRLQYAT